MKTTSIKLWLSIILGSIIAIVLVGGTTRLTGSGLSMVDWNLIMGSIPPLSEAQWLITFDAYKAFPQYQQINIHMSLSEFKGIFFWEYTHRMLGRVIGLLILIPYCVFRWKKSLSPRLSKQGLWLVSLVVLQGLVGWVMVKSGLVDDPHVSHFRLATHLLLAFLLFQVTFWVLQEQFRGKTSVRPLNKTAKHAWGLTGLLVLQITYGAFTAGTRAGLYYNTFPKMGADWLPQTSWGLMPLITNFFNNPVMIQFIHRTLAYTLTAVTIWFGVRFLKTLNKTQKRWYIVFSHALILQILLGIATLVLMVPISLALLHQLVALGLLTASIGLNTSLSNSD
ncbi:COX15/CtaA family protein [bacterium]|jgi:heme a synthase|nr:COX15/CtaA family protein [bacterium]